MENDHEYAPTLAQASQALAGRPETTGTSIGASDVLEEGLNRFAAELDQLEARLQFVLHESVDTISNPEEASPTLLHGQAYRLHRLVDALHVVAGRIGV